MPAVPLLASRLAAKVRLLRAAAAAAAAARALARPATVDGRLIDGARRSAGLAMFAAPAEAAAAQPAAAADDDDDAAACCEAAARARSPLAD